MPSSITLSHLSYTLPDDSALFSYINLHFGTERTGLVGRNGVGKSTLLRLIAGEAAPTGGAVTVQGSLAWLRQALPLKEGIVADLFGAREALQILWKAEQGEADADELAEADWTLDTKLRTALTQCGLAVDPWDKLSDLSGGERTRAGLAAQLFARPEFLLLDEPTNNLDREGRHLVRELLSNWRGGAIVVSHDRELLEQMDAIVELTSLGATRFGGPYSAYRIHKDAQLQAARRDLSDAEKAVKGAARKAQQAAERKARTDRSGQKLRDSGSQPKVLLDAMQDRSEASSAAQARLRETRRDAAQEALATAQDKIERLEKAKMTLASTGLPMARRVLDVHALTGGHYAHCDVVRDLTFEIIGPERVALTGPNGSGKSTLLSLITGALQPMRGDVQIHVPYALLDQSVSLLVPCDTIRDNFRRLNPESDDTACRAALARFIFRAEAALQKVNTLSGGEKLRAGLACTLGRETPPALLILDEPTNHLDLDAIEALEAALSAYDGAILVVSHDIAFLDRLGIDRTIELPGR